MSALVWDKSNERFYQTGIEKVALYIKTSSVTNNTNYGTGIAWSGVSSIAESPSGAESNKVYADNVEYLNLISAEELGLTLTAYDSPVEFDQCDGMATATTGVVFGQQERKEFGLAYKTRIGTNADGDSYGYKIHLVYNCKASPSERTFNTVNDSPEAIEFSWSISTTKETVGSITVGGTTTAYKPIAMITIDSREFKTSAQKAALKAFEEQLWGRDADATATPEVSALEPTLLTPAAVVTALYVAAG